MHPQAFAKPLLAAVMAFAMLLTAAPVTAVELNPMKLLFGSTKNMDVKKLQKKQAKEIVKLRKKAKKDTRAMAVLADHYFWGIGMKRSKARALELYKKSYAAGDAMAVYHMGLFYETGLDVNNDGILEIPRDPAKGAALKAKAAKGVNKLAKKGVGDALYYAAAFHELGRYGFKKDRKKFRKYLEKGADKKYPHSIVLYAEDAENRGKATEREACDMYRAAAQLGSGLAAYKYGICLQIGRGGRKKSYSNAKSWYELGARKGSSSAMNSLGNVIIAKETDKDKAKAKAGTFFEMAVHEGDPEGYKSFAQYGISFNQAYYYQQALSLDPSNSNYLWQVQNARSKDTLGRDEFIGIPPGVYSHKNLMHIAKKASGGHAGYAELAQDLILTGYIKSTVPATILSLENGFKEFGKLVYFGDNNTTITMSHSFYTSMYTFQHIISKWDIKTKQLIEIRALAPGLRIEAFSSDGRLLAVSDNRPEYWKVKFLNNQGPKLAIYDTETTREKMSLLQLTANGSWRVNFTGGDRFLSIITQTFIGEKSFDKSLVLNVADGKILHEDTFGEKIMRKVSSNGKHVIFRKDKKAGHNTLPGWGTGSVIEGLSISGMFSPDQNYFIMRDKIFDMRSRAFIPKTWTGSVTFSRVPSTPLFISRDFQGTMTWAIEGTNIGLVSYQPNEMGQAVPSQSGEEKYIISPDATLIAMNGTGKNNGLMSTFIQPFTIPDDATIKSVIASAKSRASANLEIADVLDMFEAGFGDMALEKFTEIVTAKPANIRPSAQLFAKRANIDATSLGLALKTAYEAANAAELNAAVSYLYWYGLLANAAGHADIADMAADRISVLVQQRDIRGKETDTSNLVIAFLRSLAEAKRGNMKSAYGILVASKAIKSDKYTAQKQFRKYPDLLADLYKEPKKLSYILGVKLGALPKAAAVRVKPAPYWTLDGRLIEPGVAAILEEDGGAIID
ncbi:MAG: sel1 repeat family protein [Kordiimonadaceae bacterium]|nr:sel1 repeat family protein [Kordiimonadaceae bacterium]